MQQHSIIYYILYEQSICSSIYPMNMAGAMLVVARRSESWWLVVRNFSTYNDDGISLTLRRLQQRLNVSGRSDIKSEHILPVIREQQVSVCRIFVQILHMIVGMCNVLITCHCCRCFIAFVWNGKCFIKQSKQFWGCRGIDTLSTEQRKHFFTFNCIQVYLRIVIINILRQVTAV